MCGIAGYFNLKKKLNMNDLRNNSIKMCNVLKRRGPDSQGVWVDQNLNITLSHRRLSIIDLNKRSDQPMISKNGRFVIVFNGEIYNFKELREILQIKGVKFRTNSDTEVILESFSIWGIKKTINKLQGMFAIAVWDKKKKKNFF